LVMEALVTLVVAFAICYPVLGGLSFD